MKTKKTLRMLSALLAAVILCVSFAFSVLASGEPQIFEVTAASLVEQMGGTAVLEGENTVKFIEDTVINYDIYI